MQCVQLKTLCHFLLKLWSVKKQFKPSEKVVRNLLEGQQPLQELR